MLNSGMLQTLLTGILETLYMVIVSTGIAYIIGIPVGIILHITDENGICRNKPINKILGAIVNLLRSVPFIVLLVAIDRKSVV